ncbi:hypothetical protein [Jeotgalicoccus sp. WY2]|uniref:hypothetical protein n=1 Tax=Jeotgalicoccus sp. WY2 TaxID=2708346 RepID=UPI00352FF67B
MVYNKENIIVRRLQHGIIKKGKVDTPSQTIEITNTARQLKAEGVDVISLSAGEPDFNTPDEIIEAVYEAAKAGHTKYSVCRSS